jgi:hypothetical protein
MNKLIQTTIILQTIGLVVFLLWLVFRPSGADPAEPFLVLQQFNEKYGPVRTVDALGGTIFEKASGLCRREACIQARYGGNRGRWLTITAAKQRDPCLNYMHPPCGRTAIRRELKKVVSRIGSCHVVGRLKRTSDVRLRVQCGGIQDFVTVERGARGHWMLAGDERYPGFLPRLHAATSKRTK